MAEMAAFWIASREPQAKRIANQLNATSFRGDHISVPVPDKTGTRDFAHEQHIRMREGAATGGGAGAGRVGWLIGIASLALRGVGPLIAPGPIFDALARAAGKPVHGPAPRPAPSANGPSTCPLCGARRVIAQTTDLSPVRLDARSETAMSLLRGYTFAARHTVVNWDRSAGRWNDINRRFETMEEDRP